MAYATQALKRAHALNKKSAVRTGEFDSRQCLRTSGQYQQAEEDFWRAVWSGNSKAGGYYGLARLAARNGNFDTGLDFANKVFAPAQPIRKCFACITCYWC